MDKRIDTMILVRKSTRQKLRDIGNKGDTYDDVINRLINSYKK
jgi:hypothetical protein